MHVAFTNPGTVSDSHATRLGVSNCHLFIRDTVGLVVSIRKRSRFLLQSLYSTVLSTVLD
jgi:hypothetical protein